MTDLLTAAIAGIGATEFSRDSGRTELRLATEACRSALADAGLGPRDIDGFVTFAMDNNDEQAVARNLGVEAVRFFARTAGGGGGGPGTIELAAMAIATGKANAVICYRAMNERSQQRFGVADGYIGVGPLNTAMLDRGWTSPFGMVTPATRIAQSVRRYMHHYGATSEDFGRQAVIQRAYANNNPHACFYDKPLTLEDHQSSRMIADPLRLFDCCPESDGAVAIVVTSLERARALPNPPVRILASAMGIGPQQYAMASVYREHLEMAVETRIMGDQLWSESGLSPSDIDVAILYDHFCPAVLMQLEALRLCELGEAPDLVRNGETGPGGRIPTNTNGGQLSEGYIHGFNGIAEAVRQLRGTAINQVHHARFAVVTGGSHVPTSGMILGRAES